MLVRVSLLCLLVGCRSGESDPSDKNNEDTAVDSGVATDSGSAWYDYEEDGGGGGDGDADDGKDDEDDGKDEEDDGKGDDGGGEDYDYDDCPDDFDPSEPCEVEWQDGGVCLEGTTIWYCVDGVWEYK